MLKKTILLSAVLQGLFQTATPCLAISIASLPLNANVAIPAQIRTPTGSTLILLTHAQGDQIYQCALKEGNYAWKIDAPDAKLLDADGQVVGNHYTGPVWEYKEGSRVEGRIISRLEVNPETSISWLLVKVVTHKGKGLFSSVSYINRINTHGGLPPLSGCDGNHLGIEKRIPYTADYVFYE
jgi:hypothetical protein